VTGAISQETAVAVIAAAGIGLGFVALAIVAWIFWRAAQRDRREEPARRAEQDPGAEG
jgi:hypothetical protein